MKQQTNYARSFEKLKIQEAIAATNDQSLFCQVLRLYIVDMFDDCIVMIHGQIKGGHEVLQRKQLGSDTVDMILKYKNQSA